MGGPVEIIYQHVKKQIVTKSIFPGNRILEEDLTRETGISRTSVRTALKRLQYEGFVDIFPNKGTFVVKPTYEDIKNVFQVRLYLEMGAFKLAIHNIDDAAVERMENSLKEQEKLMKNFSISEYAVLNREFHEEIVRASKNAYYEKYLNEIYNKVHIYMIFYDSANDNTRSLVTHNALMDAIKRRDVEEGIRFVRQDIENGMNDIIRF